MPRQTAEARTPDQWRRDILQYIADHPDRPLKPRSLARELAVADTEYPSFRALVRDLVSDGTLVRGPGRTIVLPEQAGSIVGTVRIDRRGDARIEQPGKPDILVRRGFGAGALDGDTAMARLLRRRGARGVRMCEITRILERAPIRWTGVLEKQGGRWVVQPQGRVATPLVEIEDPKAKSTRPGDLVVVEPLEFTLDTPRVRGVIIEKLGDPSEAQVKILGVIRRHGLPDEFPANVRRAAQRAASSWDPEDADGREDLRNVLTITIDPPDARDYDDAISIRRLDKGAMELGVHIADVSSFVREDGVIDREARARGTSAYFPGYVVPMLPEVLSNSVCSLQPNEPRFAKSVFITYDKGGNVVDARFANSVIQSDRRLTYLQASDALDGKPARLPKAVTGLLKDADALARRIRKRRLRKGMVVLTLPEVEIQLGEDGTVADAGPAESSFSHTIIEMFMVEANEAVSRLLRSLGAKHLRRIHPPPESIKDSPLQNLAAQIGVRLPAQLDRGSIQKLLDAVRDRPEEPSVNLMLLQSFAKACYSPELEGHFALASDDYCHFTSPIRRYPDLVNHRLLDLFLHGKLSKKKRSRTDVPSDAEIGELGQKTSQLERRAEAAEREAKFLLLLELMKSLVGEVLDGVVVGVTRFGVFVQMQPYLAEGLLHVSDLGHDTWRLDERTGTLVGERSGRSLRLGQPLKVRVAAVDEVRQTIGLVAADGVRSTTGGPPARRKTHKSPKKQSSGQPSRAARTKTRRARRRR